MTLATELVHDYRFALRHIWNNYFWRDEERRDFHALGSFNQLKAPLFRALVGDPLGHTPTSATEIFGDKFILTPSENGRTIRPFDVDIGNNRQYERMSGLYQKEETRMVLLDCYDWLEVGYWDLHYYLVRIDRFEKKPELVGCKAVVEVIDVDVLWDG